MTQTPENETYPTPWRVVDIVTRSEARQTSADTWQLRSPTHLITIDTIGFNLFRENDQAAWEQYLTDNHIKAEGRMDL